jgi:hypothetical protein
LRPVPPGFDQHVTECVFDGPSQTLIFTRENGREFRVPIGGSTDPVITELVLLDIPSHIDNDADLIGNHNITFHIANAANVQTMDMQVNTNIIDPIVVTTSDGRQSTAFNISAAEWTGLIAGDPGTLDFQLVGTDINSGPVTSNIVRVIRSADAETFYYALSDTSNAASIDISTMSTRAIQGESDTFDITLGPTTANQHVIMLFPGDYAIRSILNKAFGNRDVLSAFTVTTDVRTIDSQTFGAAVFGPVNAGFTLNYTINLEEII